MKKYFLLLILVICVNQVFSQQDNGRVTYKATMWKQKEFGLDTVKISNKAKSMLKKLANNKGELFYSLSFNQGVSVFKKEEDLELQKNIMLDVYVGKGEFYYNRISGELINKKASGSKGLLIQYPKVEWEMTNETKMINGFLCGKANATVIRGRNQKSSKIVAWYAFQFPYNYGPNQFTGLPGLILELSYEGRYTLKATKIELSKNKKFKVNFPAKGEKISYEKYEEKLRKRFERGRKNNF